MEVTAQASELEGRGRAILEGAALAVLLVDADGRVVQALGDPDALGGRVLVELVGHTVAEALCQWGLPAERPAAGAATVTEVQGRWLELRALRPGGAGPVREIVVVHDLTSHGREDADARDRMRETQQLARQIPCAAWATDRDLRILQFLGRHDLRVSAEGSVAVSLRDLARTDDPTDPAIASHAAALRGESSSFRYRLGDRWYEVHVEPLRDEAGTITGCIGAAVDVTDRKAMEDQILASEAKLAEEQQRSISLLEATIESTADGLLVVDPDGRVVAYNTRFVALWGLPPELLEQRDDAELLGFVVDQLAEPDDFLEGVRGVYSQGNEESLDVLRFRDGRVYERYSRPQRVGDAIVGRVWSFRDVTERERVVRHAMFLADASRLLTTLEAEAAFEAVARLAVPAIAEVCAIEIVAEGDARRVLALARAPGSTASTELASPTRTDHATLGDVGGRSQLTVPILAFGRVAGLVTLTAAPGRGFVHGVLELMEEVARRIAIALQHWRQYRAAQDEIRAREEFLAIASHEIRGPIASIRLAVQALRQDLAPAAPLIDVIDREERRLARLVDELLDLGRVKTGQLHLVLEPVDLAAVARDVVSRLSSEFARSGSTVSLRADGEAVGCWDRLRIDQVVVNLMSNAVKFGLGRPIEVAVTSRDGHAVLTVTDHGLGIRPELQEAIFEPFERAVPARHYGGLGLGLYIVRTIVVGLGGRIEVQSVPGGGSTFTVELPLERPP